MENQQPARRVRSTLRDVAREAGVHRSTAAAILNHSNGNSRASQETRERVLLVARRLGYRPNRLAQDLRRQRSTTVGLVAGTVQNPFFAQMATLLERFLLERGYELVMSMDAGLYRDDRPLLETLLARNVDGIIYWSERDTDGRHLIETENVCPVVVFGNPIPHIDSVTVDFGLGARLAVEHLASRGRRRIGCFLPSESSTLWSGEWRVNGYREAVAALGLPPRIECFEGSLGDIAQATEAAEAIGRSPDCPDALFCFNDLVAISAMMGLRRAGRRVPDDVAIVGFDNIPMVAALDVPMTTLDMPMTDLCRTAVDLVLDHLLDSQESASAARARHIRLSPKLIVRASS